MTQIPAGWYPDPDPDAPEPRGTRYWDGQIWTEHVQPATGQAPSDPAQAPTAPAGSYPTGRPVGQPGGQSAAEPGGQPVGHPPQAPAYTPMSPYAGAVGPGGPTTPDGQVLSSWGRRAGAWVIDVVVWLVATSIIGIAWLQEIFTAYSDFFSRAFEAGQGGQPPSMAEQMEFAESITGPIQMITLLGIAVSLVYNAGLWKWRGATLGQMAVGIKVRLRERPGPLPWGTVLLRWVGKQGYRLLGLVPFLGLLGYLYQLLNYLWPLWDDKNQALHDKLAKTNVVRK